MIDSPLLKAILIGLMLCMAVGSQASDVTGRKMFVVHFSLGEKWDAKLSPAEQANFKQHSENLTRLRNEGSIVFGARYADVGMLVMRSASIEAVTAEIEKDPGVIAGIFDFKIDAMNVFYPWQE